MCGVCVWGGGVTDWRWEGWQVKKTAKRDVGVGGGGGRERRGETSAVVGW